MHLIYGLLRLIKNYVFHLWQRLLLFCMFLSAFQAHTLRGSDSGFFLWSKTSMCKMCAGSLSKALLGTVLCLLCSHLTALQVSGWAPSPSKGWWKKASVWIDCLTESIFVSAEQRSCGIPMEHAGIAEPWSWGARWQQKRVCSKKLCQDSQEMLTDQLGIPSPSLTSTQVLNFQKLLTKRKCSVNSSLGLLKVFG